jgi:acyl-CoA thioesterase-1
MQLSYRRVSRNGQHWMRALSVIAVLGFGVARAAAPPPPPVHLLILGDSLTAGYGLPVADGFQARLATALRAHGANVVLVNGAVSGDTTADAAGRLNWVLDGGHVDAALVELGANDGLRGLSTVTMQRNLTRILNTLAAKHIPVLLSGMIAPPSFGTAYEDRFKAVFAALGKRKGVLFDPFFLQGLPGKPGLVQADGLHPNAAGVRIEVKRLLPLVLHLLAKVKPPERP